MSMHRCVVVASLPMFFAAGTPIHARIDSPYAARASAARASAPDACALLSESDVSTALEVKSLAGTSPVAGNTKICGWSDVAGNDIDHRRVVLSITSADAFNSLKSRGGAPFTIEPVSGIGDEAFYEMTKSSESPLLFVRKGSSAFSVRILNGLKLKAFTRDEEKAKEAALGKAAAARL